MFLLFLTSVVEIEGYDSICYLPTLLVICGALPLMLFFFFSIIQTLVNFLQCSCCVWVKCVTFVIFFSVVYSTCEIAKLGCCRISCLFFGVWRPSKNVILWFHFLQLLEELARAMYAEFSNTHTGRNAVSKEQVSSGRA